MARRFTAPYRQTKGFVLRISRFSTEDGPGIRTVVFMKGCPLRCLWCSTPESQKRGPEILYIESRCKRRGRCVEVCPEAALKLTEEGLEIDRGVCSSCGECVNACPNRALRLEGKWLSVDEVFAEVAKDSSFYRRSGGGITISGGEPTMQAGFVRELLKKCKQHYISTAIETCGHCTWATFRMLLEYLDIVFFDIKHLDPIVHRELTGASNKRIVENARRTCSMRPMVIRVPTIPGHNDSEQDIASLAKFAADLGQNLQRIELLPYHRFGEHTYGRLGREYRLKEVLPPSDSHMERLKDIIDSYGVRVRIGGT